MTKDDVTKLRKSMSMTQSEFADFCGVSLRTVQKWEAGSTLPPLVCKFFDLINEKNAHYMNHENLGIDDYHNHDELFVHCLDEIAEQRKLTSKVQEEVIRLTEALIHISEAHDNYTGTSLQQRT